MTAGYTRQSSATIVAHLQITAASFNNEFNALASAFDNTNGHNHSGTVSGTGANINLSGGSQGVTGVLGTGNGGTNASSWTTGSVVFASSSTALNQSNSTFFWDNTNKRLGIGTSSPTSALTVNGQTNVIGAPTSFSALSAGTSMVAIGASSSYALAGTFAGLAIVSNDTTGDTACYVCGGGVCVLLTSGSTAGTWVGSTTGPGAGKASIAYDGAGHYRVYTGSGANANYGIMLLATRNVP